MKKQNVEKIISLRLWHSVIIAFSALSALAVIFIDNWNEIFMWLSIAVAILCSNGKYEKVDELAKQNIAKANTIAMWLLFAALCYFGMYARYHEIPALFIIIAIFSVLAIRSILFLIFDTSFGETEESDG